MKKITATELNSSRSLLCVDHCAMSIPSKEMMDWVYKGTLFGELVKGAGLDFFGSYDMKAVKKKNMEMLNSSNDMIG